MSDVGNYRFKPYSKQRRNIEHVTREGWRRHSIRSLLEIDVTDALKDIKKIREKKGKKISFTGWVITCVSQAITDNKDLNSYRHGRRKIVIFDDVDVGIPIERETDGGYQLLAYVLRRANEKNVFEITDEIRKAQREEIDSSTQVLGKKLNWVAKFALKAPSFIQRFFMFLIRRNGIFRKKYTGTIGVTAIGMKGHFPGWVIPLGGTPAVLVVLTGIIKKPVVVKNEIKIRDMLHVTISVDHDIVDGGPLARFVETLIDLMQNSYGLIKE